MTEAVLPPSRNPADDDTLAGLLHVVLKKFLQDVDNMLPAKVINYNRTTNLAQVQPLINIVTTNNDQLARPQILSVPVVQIGGGGFMLNFPIKTGDLGFIKSNDRDISLFLQTAQQSVPNTGRFHSFSDAVFIPTVLLGYTIAASDSTNVVLQSLNGSIRLSMGTGVGITDNTSYSSAASAVLDVQSTTKAFKVPVMTRAQKNAISSPQAGYVVFDTTGGGLSVYNGSTWS